MRRMLPLLLCLALAGCSSPRATPTGVAASLPLTSPSFEAGQLIPARFTCDGENLSPPLAWGDPPAGTRSFILIFDDPDAPLGTWVHWLVLSIPPETRSLPEALQPGPAPAQTGISFGRNSWNEAAYGGPCPPSGRHRYVFHLYALDASPVWEAQPTAEQVLAAIAGHLLAYGELAGEFR